MTRVCLLLLAAMCLAALTPAIAAAQEPPTLEYGAVVRMHSAALGEDRRINVFLPPEYATSTARFPVIYLLDGSANEDYLHATGLFDFLATYNVMPATIVVGISNVDRRRDFTMPSSVAADKTSAPTSGGALKFMQFLEQDLIPYVNAHYRTAEPSTLIGQSLGGLIATQILLERPQMFTNYVIVSPSLWWDDKSLLKRAPALLAKNRAGNRHVYFSLANEGSEMKTADEAFIAQIKTMRPDITCFYEYLPSETHATSLHISLYNAMHLLFKNAVR